MTPEKIRDFEICANIGLVHRVAQRFKFRCNNTSICYSDLVQEGIIGLIIAHSKYNCNRGTRFSTFANYWIEAKIRRLLDRHTSTIHVTYSASAIYNDLVKKYSSGRDGTTLDMIKKVQSEYAEDKLSYRNYCRYIAILLARSPEHYNHISMDMPQVYPSSGGDFTVQGDSSSVSKEIQKATSAECGIEVEISQRTLIEKMLDKLDKEAQTIVIMYYGLRGNPSHTYEELAAKMKCSKQRIHQQHKKIIAKLRIYLKEVGVSDSINPKEFLE